jgi:hypothetical protein
MEFLVKKFLPPCFHLLAGEIHNQRLYGTLCSVVAVGASEPVPVTAMWAESCALFAFLIPA